MSKQTPKRIAKIIISLFVLLFIVIFYPMNLVFAGKWIIKQNIELTYIEEVVIPISDINSSLEDITFPIGQLSIRYYAIMLTLGLLSGYWLSLYLSKRNLVVSIVVDRLFIGIVFLGFLGARLFYVIFNWATFYNPESWSATFSDIILNINQGGLSIFGAIIGASIYIYYYCKRFYFNPYEFFDFLAPGLLIGQIIGRFGNFFNYEAYGPSTKVLWKMFVPPTNRFGDNQELEFYHPTFLYEIIPNIILLYLLLSSYDKLTQKNSGQVLSFYLIGYGIIRFVTEFYRLDALYINIPVIDLVFFEINKILISQVLAICLIILGYLLYQKRKKILYLKKHMTEIQY